jgi:hypothetical protein
MVKNKNIKATCNPAKVISIGIMCFCLLFLTGINFIVYAPSDPSSQNILAQQSNNTNDEESPSPVEEKSSSKTGVTVQEEYVHDVDLVKGDVDIVYSSEHKIPAEEKLQIVHFELISPPPKA